MLKKEVKMDFLLTDHVILFILGLIFLPRVMLLYCGLVPAESVLSIVGLFLAPRIFLAILATPELWGSHSFFVIIIWLIAVAGDVYKFVMNIKMFNAMREEMVYQYNKMLTNQRGF